MHFKINLTLISVLIIVLFFNIPFYNNWMNTNLLNPAFDILATSKQLGLEQRMVNRFGYSYVVYKEMAGYFKNSKIKDPLILLPPEALMKEQKVKNFTIVEPTTFYYFTGYKAVWYDSPGVEKANLALVFDKDGKVMVRKIESKDDLNRFLATYRKYKLEL